MLFRSSLCRLGRSRQRREPKGFKLKMENGGVFGTQPARTAALQSCGPSPGVAAARRLCGRELQIENKKWKIKMRIRDTAKTAEHSEQKHKQKTPRGIRGVRSGGGGGSRTRVQTGNPKAFYTLIRPFVLLPAPGRRLPNTGPSSFVSHAGRNAPTRYLRMNDTPCEAPLGSGTALRDTRLRTTWGPGIKPIFLEN